MSALQTNLIQNCVGNNFYFVNDVILRSWVRIPSGDVLKIPIAAVVKTTFFGLPMT